MYLYIYDSFLNDKKYTDLLIKIEKRITDLGIKGKVARLSVLKNMKELIMDGVKEGVQTVVAIGNNQTCDILASRIIKKIDLGKINNYYFINTAEIVNGDVVIEYNNFKVQPITRQNKITLYNFATNENARVVSNPVDGILEAVITPIKSTIFGKKNIAGTVLPFTKIKIGSNADEQISILTDEQIIMKTPAEISVVPQKLKIIVGSERSFE
jgi:hypothetical protein